MDLLEVLEEVRAQLQKQGRLSYRRFRCAD